MMEKKDEELFGFDSGSFRGVQIDPSWSRLDCLLAVAECASYLLERKMEKKIKEEDDSLKKLIKQRFFNQQQTRKRGRRLYSVSPLPLPLPAADDDQENQEKENQEKFDDDQENQEKENQEKFDEEKEEEEEEEGNINKRQKKNTDPRCSSRQLSQKYRTTLQIGFSSRQLPQKYRTTLEIGSSSRQLPQEYRANFEIGSSSRQLPREYRTALERHAVGKMIQELNLVLSKNIYKTDISPTHARLSLPKNKQEHSFLTEEEENYLKLSHLNDNGKKVSNSMEVDVIDPSLEICKLELKNWAISKGMYVLTKHWNDLVERNSIQIDETIEVWTVRVNQKLWFILVRVPEASPEQD